MSASAKHGGWRARLRRLLRSEGGVAAVELAWIAPVLAVVIVGVVDYGRLYSRSTTLSNAARAGTQFAMIVRPNGEVAADIAKIRDKTQLALPADFTGPAPTVNMLCDCPPPNATSLRACATIVCASEPAVFIDITVTEPAYPTLFDYPFIPDTFPLSGRSVMRLR